VLTALYARDRPDSPTGQCGQLVDVSLAESCLAILESTVPDHSATGLVRQPGGTRLDGIAPSNLHRSVDGRRMVIAANQNSVFARLCGAMDRPDLASDPRFATHAARGRRQDEIDAIVAEWAAHLTAEELTTILDDAGVVVGPVNTVAEVVEDPPFLARTCSSLTVTSERNARCSGPGWSPSSTARPRGERTRAGVHPPRRRGE
jgi:formyl-CoA transferase